MNEDVYFMLSEGRVSSVRRVSFLYTLRLFCLGLRHIGTNLSNYIKSKLSHYMNEGLDHLGFCAVPQTFFT